MTRGEHDPFVVAYLDSEGMKASIERDVIEAAGGRLAVGNCTTDDEVMELAAEADAVLCRLYPLTGELLHRLPRLRCVSRSGVGYDNVDVETATTLGIAVCNVVDYGYDEVANHAFALLLALNRKLFQLDSRLRRGERVRIPLEDPPAFMLPTGRIAGQTLGLLAFGRIAQEMARRAAGFRMRVIACDPFGDKAIADEMGVELTTLDRLLTESDYLSIHAPLTPATRGIIGVPELARMKSSAYLILTARGGIVDELALTDALRNGIVAGAGIDTWATEPVRPDHELLGMDNVIATPHSAFFSEVSVETLRHRFADSAVDICRGVTPRSLVNPEVAVRLGLSPRTVERVDGGPR